MSSGMTAYKEEILAAADIAEEQRIFIETKQKYCKVKIGLKTRARDVLKTVAATGQLKGPHSDERAIGGWMVYEVANDFGMGAFPHNRHVTRQFLSPFPQNALFGNMNSFQMCSLRGIRKFA